MSDQGEGKGGLFRSLLGQAEDDSPRLERSAPPPPPSPPGTIDLTAAPGEQDLIAAIESPDPEGRRVALAALVGRDLSPRLARAAAAVLKDPQPDLRLAALRVIEQAPRLVPPESLEAATVDWNPHIRARALAALARTQRASVLATLHQRLASETEESVIDAALVALGQLLQTAVRPFPPSTLRGVASAVAQLSPQMRARHRSELGLIARVIREDDLIELLLSADEEVRLGAAALSLERASDATCRALAGLVEDADPQVRDLAERASSALRTGPLSDTGAEAGFDVDRYGRRAGDVARRTREPAEGEGSRGAPGEVTTERTGSFADLLESLAPNSEDDQSSLQRRVASIGRERLTDLVESYLEDRVPGRAERVAVLLIRTGRTELIPFLARSVLELSEGAERDEVVHALRSFPDTWRLIAILQDDPSSDRRKKGLLLATLLDTDRTAPIAAALADPHTGVRLAAIAASEKALKGEVVERLMEIISSDTSPAARVAAISRFQNSPAEVRVLAAERALRTHVTEARRAAVGLLTGGSDEELGLLARALHDHEIGVAEEAISHLGSLRAPEALAVLWSSLRLVQPPVQGLILTAMEEFDREAVVFLGRQALDSPDASDRVLGLAVLSRLETDPSDRLSMALDDPSPAVRLEALRNTLGRPDPSVVHAVGARLRDPEPAVRALALEVLESIEDDRTLPFFVDGAKDPAPEVRRAAKDALLRHSSDAVIDLLLRALEFPTHRRAAADLLIELGRPAVERLTEALPGADPDVRRMIGEVLRDSDSQGLLIEELSHRDPARRLRAVSGLGAIRSQQAVPALIERIRDPDASVRAEVAKVLGRLGDRRAVEPLKKAFISDPDMEVVRAIEPALRKLTGETR